MTFAEQTKAMAEAVDLLKKNNYHSQADSLLANFTNMYLPEQNFRQTSGSLQASTIEATETPSPHAPNPSKT